MERDPSLREDLDFEGVVVGENWQTPSHQASDKDISDFAFVTQDHHPLMSTTNSRALWDFRGASRMVSMDCR